MLHILTLLGNFLKKSGKYMELPIASNSPSIFYGSSPQRENEEILHGVLVMIVMSASILVAPKVVGKAATSFTIFFLKKSNLICTGINFQVFSGLRRLLRVRSFSCEAGRQNDTVGINQKFFERRIVWPQVDNIGTKNLVDACQQRSIIRQLFVSSTYANDAAMEQIFNPM
jgi:hypothetical protein